MSEDFIIKVPDQIYKKFKEAVAENDSNITAEVVHFMEQYGSGEMWEIASGVNVARFDNIFVGLDTILFQAKEGTVKIRKV